jgi:hypothetical protein
VEVDNTEMTVEKGFSFLTAIGREPADFVEEDEEGQSSFVVASAAGRSAVESGRPLQTNGVQNSYRNLGKTNATFRLQ